MEKKKMKIVSKIIKDVMENRDDAVRLYTKRFDKADLERFEVSRKEINEAYRQVSDKTIKALNFAKRNIVFFAKQQLKQLKDFEISKDGVVLGQTIIPIEKIGVYIPGGNYPLPSTALMCIIPAKLAGARQIIACSPKIKPETIVAADIAGADTIFKIGGVQAIAAMAYGTKQIPKVGKIVGPGNAYVTSAKKYIYGDCGIDILAGPSEIMIIADKYTDYRFIAADLLAQLEHDINAKAILATSSEKVAALVKKEVQNQLTYLPTKEIIKKSIKNLKIISSKNMGNLIMLANEIAPEHLSIQARNSKKIISKLKNYGSLFIGNYSAVAFGDYCSGTNHVLPTGSNARFASGLSVRDFVKVQTYQKISRNGAKKLAQTALMLSKVEGLEAHNKSIRIRLSDNYLNPKQGRG